MPLCPPSKIPRPFAATIQYPCQAWCSTPKARTQNSGIQFSLFYFISDRSQQDHAKNLSFAHLYSMPPSPLFSHPYPHLLLHFRHSSLICSLTFFVLFCSKIFATKFVLQLGLHSLLRSFFHPILQCSLDNLNMVA